MSSMVGASFSPRSVSVEQLGEWARDGAHDAVDVIVLAAITASAELVDQLGKAGLARQIAECHLDRGRALEVG